MSKFLLLILVIAAVWWLAKGFRRNDTAPDAPDKASEQSSEQIVKCGHCGLYLPQSEAIREGDKFFCCAEHRLLAG